MVYKRGQKEQGLSWQFDIPKQRDNIVTKKKCMKAGFRVPKSLWRKEISRLPTHSPYIGGGGGVVSRQQELPFCGWLAIG